MPTTFRQSSPGRLLLLAGACFLASAAALLVSGSLYAIGIGMPIGITIAFVAVGLGISDDYIRETLFAVCLLPPALWGFYYLMGELHTGSQAGGWLMALVAAGMLGLAAFPGGSED
jgi:hypothetical protein